MNNITINNFLRISLIIGLAIIPFIPIYVANPLFFPFITGKAFVFRIIVEIIITVVLLPIFIKIYHMKEDMKVQEWNSFINQLVCSNYFYLLIN